LYISATILPLVRALLVREIAGSLAASIAYRLIVDVFWWPCLILAIFYIVACSTRERLRSLSLLAGMQRVAAQTSTSSLPVAYAAVRNSCFSLYSCDNGLDHRRFSESSASTSASWTTYAALDTLFELHSMYTELAEACDNTGHLHVSEDPGLTMGHPQTLPSILPKAVYCPDIARSTLPTRQAALERVQIALSHMGHGRLQPNIAAANTVDVSLARLAL
ncbi:hypothetical protein THASP1DRAFT_23918, partial [Thamnocephalis sphaerospora]